MVVQRSKISYSKFSSGFLWQDSKSYYSFGNFGNIQNVGGPELFEEKIWCFIGERYTYNSSFLESLFLLDCVIKKTPCLPIISEDFDKSWRNALRESELKLMNALTEEHAVSYLD